jgi:hypothetical protein
MLKGCVRHFALVIMFFLFSVWPTYAVQVPAGLHSCSSLAECLKLLDAVASTAGPGMGPEEEDIRGILKKFGEPAKHELLRRAVGNKIGWRHLAGAILWGWGALDPFRCSGASFSSPQRPRRLASKTARRNRHPRSNTSLGRRPSQG